MGMVTEIIPYGNNFSSMISLFLNQQSLLSLLMPRLEQTLTMWSSFFIVIHYSLILIIILIKEFEPNTP